MSHILEYDFLIVGCGLSGSVMAERIANVLRKKVLIIDKRNHIGGNCYDFIEPETGIRVNKYGAHIFHTNDDMVWKYINQFCKWIRYDHKVLSYIDHQYVPFPININTINKLFNENIKNGFEMELWLDKKRITYKEITNGEELIKSIMGADLYEKFYKYYTFKQWNKYPNELHYSILKRVQYRTNFDDRYFTDKYQALPEKGYTYFFEQLLDHPLITIKLNCSYENIKSSIDHQKTIIIYTGPIDQYFDNDLPKLEYRSINFHYEIIRNTHFYQPTAVVNYPSIEYPFTRIVEYKHFLNQQSPHTIIVKETTTDNGDPYYPVINDRNLKLYEQYQKLTENFANVYFLGRLANYKYFNMDEAIKNSIEFFRKNIEILINRQNNK